MKNETDVYESPQIKVVRIIAETAFLTMSNGNFENPIEGEESDW